MGSLISSFTVGRNALKRDTELSALAAMESIVSVRSGQDLSVLKAVDNGKYNVIRDLISFTGIIKREENKGTVTEVGEAYERLFGQNPSDAWRWLLTRTLWLYTVPNGTQAAVNKASADYKFDFFRRFLGLLVALSSLPSESRFLSYEEICILFDSDDAWDKEPAELFSRVVANRVADPKLLVSNRSFLDDLEPQYGIPRDNFAALIGKAFSQTGLFEYRRTGQKTTAISLSKHLDSVLQGRVRFVLDHPQAWDGGDWDDHLSAKHDDLPEEVSLVPTEDVAETEAQEPLVGMVDAAVADFRAAGLSFSESLVSRFAASLIAKRFVILTGLSGSGKTKLAQAFASWMSPRWVEKRIRLSAGAVIESDRVQYRILSSDEIAVEFESVKEGESVRVALPYALIDEWIDQIQQHKFTRDTPAREIRDAVTRHTLYSTQLSSFESPLKALAFALLDRWTPPSPSKHVEIVSVGPDWHSKDASLGYVDALNSERYIRSTPIIDLMLRALAAPSEPFFLIMDEMNLSHVERYFADFLSAAESGEAIYLHGHAKLIDGVPPRLPWPSNLFIIGTVNVDETTYVFSPKVLDRANTIEFRLASENMDAYLSNHISAARIRMLDGRGARFSSQFLKTSEMSLEPNVHSTQLAQEMRLLFRILQAHGSEFGFRTAKEIAAFFQAFIAIRPALSDFYFCLDVQILQKILPRMNGSRQRLQGVLCALAVYCEHRRQWSSERSVIDNFEEIITRAQKAPGSVDPAVNPLIGDSAMGEGALLPQSYEKLKRLHYRASAEGFASFAEA